MRYQKPSLVLFLVEKISPLNQNLGRTKLENVQDPNIKGCECHNFIYRFFLETYFTLQLFIFSIKKTVPRPSPVA